MDPISDCCAAQPTDQLQVAGSWTFDASRISAASVDLAFTSMQGQQMLHPAPLLTLREQTELWSEELRFPKGATLAWLLLAGVGRKWRDLAAAPDACEAFDARSSWRPSPTMWSNFSVVPSGFAAGADSPRDPLTRAARLVVAAQQVHSEFVDRRLKPERAGNHDLDLSQLANVFRGIGLFQSRPRWCCPPVGLSYFCVLRCGRPYFLPMPPATEDLAAVRTALAEIVEDAQSRDEPSMMPLSAMGIRGLRSAGLDRSEDVRLLVNAIGAARFVLSLDLDSMPEDDRRVGYLTQVSFTNRWYLHGCNIVVFGNGATGIHLSFGAGIDGNVGVRFAAEVADRVRSDERDAPPPGPRAAYSTFARGRRVTLTPHTESRFLSAAMSWTKTSADVFTLPLGASACLASGARPVEAFVTALSATVASLAGRQRGRPCRVPIRQFVSQGRHKFGTLNSVDVNMPEVFAAAQLLLRRASAADRPGASRRAYAAAEGAIRSRTELARRSRCFSRRLTRGSARRVLGYVAIAPALLAFRAWTRLAKPRMVISEVAISYVSKKDGIAIVARPGARAPRGKLWLHYQIFEDRTVVVPCMGADSPIPESLLVEQLSAHWRALLERLAVSKE